MLRRMYVIGTKIVNAFREVKAENTGNINNCYQATPFGFEANPIKGMDAIMGDTDRYTVILGYIQKAIDGLNEGETISFAKNSSGEVKATITHRSDDTIELLGTGDYLVRFEELKTEFNELKETVNNHIDDWNLFANAYVPGGPSTQGLPPTASSSGTSSADIDNARHDELKTTERPN